jgi:hypothetical protein
MKTTIDLPDPLFRPAKATTSSQGITLKAFITEAVETRLGLSNRSVSDLVNSLQRIPAESLSEIDLRVAEMDADNLRFQAEAADRTTDP